MNWPDDFINKIICGDCLEVMKEMPKNSIDAIVTDPPYGLEFMGKEWDKLWDKRKPKENKERYVSPNGCIRKTNPVTVKLNLPNYQAGMPMQLWHTQWLTEAYRVLKPGGSMLVMGGTRTSHRLACAIEDTGFIIKDTLMWIYGSGFPKAQEASVLVDAKILGISTKKVKQRREKIGIDANFLKRNPISNHKDDYQETYGNPSYKDGMEGAMRTKPLTPEGEYWNGFKVGGIKPAYEPIIWAVKAPEGSYVDNVLKWRVGALNVDECRIGVESNDENKRKATGKMGGSDSCFGVGNKYRPETLSKDRFPANVILDEKAGKMLDEQSGNLSSGKPAGIKAGGKLNCYGVFAGGIPVTGIGDSGGASRFFYCAKASKSERGENNKHPTVKPIALFMWLIQLVTREEQLILDPFIGSGTTMLASQRCNRRCIGIEKEEKYCKIAEERLAQGVL